MTPEEFEFFARHRGGFDREFFKSNLVHFLALFLQSRGIPFQEVEVLVRLEHGEEFATTGAQPALTWVAFDTETGESVIVPMTAVRSVRFRPRENRSGQAIGFTVTPVENMPEDGPDQMATLPPVS